MTDVLTHAYDRYREVRFFGSLNGLRFLCIIAVMWHHSPARGVSQDLYLFFQRGFVGVDFFFVLSGFLITTLLLREEARKGRFSLNGFYWRRILRIVPVYFLVVTAVASYYVLYKARADLVPLVPYYYLFLSNVLIEDIPLLTITWSLAVEEQYYLIWPLLLMLLPLKGQVRFFVLAGLIAFCAAAAMGAGGLFGIRPVVTEHARWALPVAGYQAILIGTLMALLLHSRASFMMLFRGLGHRFAPLACFAALGAWLSLMPGALQGLPSLIMHVLMALCLVTLVIREDHIMGPVLAWWPIARIGEISYGLYLYHLIGRHIAVEAGAVMWPGTMSGIWMMTLVFVVISIAIADLSFRTYERYFLSFKDRNPMKAR